MDGRSTGNSPRKMGEILAFAANVATIAGVVLAKASGTALGVAVFALGLAGYGWLLFRRQWRIAALSSVVIVVGLLVVVADLYVSPTRSTDPRAAATATTSAAAVARKPNPDTDSPTAQIPSAAGAQTLSPTPEPSSRVFKDIVLKQHAGVDVDGADALVAPGLNGITGDNDIYHDSTPVSSNNLITPDGLYAYPASENVANAYTVCSDYLSDSHNQLAAGMGFGTSRSFCFKTSDNHLAWAQMTAVEGSPGIYKSVTLRIRVWGSN